MQSGMKNLDPSVAQQEYQRACASFDEALDKLASVQQALPRVLAELRAAQPQLEYSCIAPERNIPLLNFD